MSYITINRMYPGPPRRSRGRFLQDCSSSERPLKSYDWQKGWQKGCQKGCFPLFTASLQGWIDLFVVLKKSLDRAMFLCICIQSVRLDGVRASITIVYVQKFYKMHETNVRFRVFFIIAKRAIERKFLKMDIFLSSAVFRGTPIHFVHTVSR